MTAPKRTRQLSGVNSLRALALLVDHPTGLGITEMSRKLEMDGAQCHRPVNGLRSAGYVTKTNSNPGS